MSIESVRDDLYELGFWFVKNDTYATLELRVELAVREFQRYAKMPRVAMEPAVTPERYWSRLVSVENDIKYEGPINGNYQDGPTAGLISQWKARKWRCPVVIVAFKIAKDGSKTLLKENIWLYDDVEQESETLMFARDLSGYYVPPQGINDLSVLGKFFKYKPKPSLKGPVSLPKAGCLDSASITPETLVGHALTPQEVPTYKVVRSAARVECLGFFDCINAWDRVFISIGCYHWTLGGVGQAGELEPGELGGYLAYLLHTDEQEGKTAFKDTVGIYGLSVERKWETVGQPGGLFNPSKKTYETRLTQLSQAGQPVPITDPIAAKFFRSWHWFYRFEMACRVNEGFRRKMWDMTRLRIRDILNTPWRSDAQHPPKMPVEGGGTRLATIGEVYSSEMATAMVLRWHILLPGEIVTGSFAAGYKVAKTLNAAFEEARKKGLDTSKLVTEWPECSQDQLIQGLNAKAANRTSLTDTLAVIQSYKVPPNLGLLSRKKGSFTLHTEGLPLAPSSDAFSDAGESVPEADSVGQPLKVTAEWRVVFEAYEGDALRYRVESNGQTLRQHYNNDLGEPVFDDPPNSIRNRVNRLALFYDDQEIMAAGKQPQPLWVFPVIPQSVSELEVDDEGKPNARLKVTTKLRCLLPPIPDESLKLEFEVDHEASGGGRRGLRFRELEIQFIGEIEHPVPLSPTGPLRNQILIKKEVPGGFDTPEVARKIGLRGRETLDSYKYDFSFGFWPNRAYADQKGGDVPALVMGFNWDLALDDDPQFVLPFDLSFSAQEVPWKKRNQATHSGNPKQPFITLTHRQRYGERWDVARPGVNYWILEVDLPQSVIFYNYNRLVVEPIIYSLRTVQGGRPVSLFPSLSNRTGVDAKWRAAFSIIDRSDLGNVPRDQFRLAYPGSVFEEGEVSICGRAVSPAEAGGTKVNGTLNGLKTTNNGQPLVCSFEVLPPSDRIKKDWPETENNNSPSFLFNLKHSKPETGTEPKTVTEQLVRMGALQIAFLPTRRPASDQNEEITSILRNATALVEESYVIASFSGVKPSGGTFAGEIRERDTNYTLAAMSVAPGGQDDVPGEEYLSDLGLVAGEEDQYLSKFRRSPALVLNKNSSQQVNWDAPFLLTVRERTEPTKSQTIQLQLRRGLQNLTGSITSAYVFDPQPFLICRVEVEDFEKNLIEGITDEIGNWTNRADVGAGWELSQGAEGFSLILPPQGIGEAMHRRASDKDIQPGQPANFRFSPTTRLTLKASYFKQRFVEAPWNLRRILGYPGQRAPGAEVTKLDFELFYGLRGTVETGKVEGQSIRLAEIGARLGNLAGAQPRALPWRSSEGQNSRYEQFRKFWASLYSSLLSRLAVLEPWDAARPRELVISQDQGLSFDLRRTTKLRYPIPGAKPDPNLAGEFVSYDDLEGLASGWAWGFESNNILEAVLKNRRATASQVARLFFSALGGWGHQKASFDRGLTTIYSEVVMGRTSSINIERIGRIGVFWNRAKHVIVYERTVVPSRQFFLEQGQFIGMPILRKVDEYVEILEEERPFPDTDTQKEMRGFVLGCRFAGAKPPRIHVNSRWGEDVGAYGWKIPLWVRGAAPADVYPKPAIFLVVAGERAGQTAPVAIDDPDKLYFYTSTDEKLGNDTDDWPAVEGVDFMTLLKDALTPPSPGTAEGDPKNFSKDDAPIKVGSGRFTFNLAPSSSAINVVEDRTPQNVISRMHNVMVMRGVVVDDGAENSDYQKVIGLTDHLSNAFASALPDLPIDAKELPSPRDLIDKVKTSVGKFKEEFDRVRQFLPTDDTLCQELRRRLQRQFEFSQDLLRLQSETVLTGLLGRFHEAFQEIKSRFPDPAAARDHLLQIAEDLVESEDGARALMQRLRGSVGEVLAALERAKAEIESAVRLGSSAIRDAQCVACAQWPAAPESLDAPRSRLSDALRKVDFVIAEAVRHWVGNRMDAVRLELSGDRSAIESSMRELHLRLLAIQKITDPQQLRDAQKKFLEDLEKIVDLLTALLDTSLAKIKEKWQDTLASLKDDVFDEPLNDLRRVLIEVISDPTLADWDQFNRRLEQDLGKFYKQLPDVMSKTLKKAAGALDAQAAKLCAVLPRNFLPAPGDLLRLLDEHFNPQRLEDLFNHLGGQRPTNALIRRELESIYNRMLEGVGEFTSVARAAFPNIDQRPLKLADSTLRLLRGFGDAPRLPNLTFAPLRNGYYFFSPADSRIPDLLSKINLSPLTARANEALDHLATQARDLLNPLDIQIPTTQLFDKLIPHKLDNFDLSKVFPNFAGLQLSSLFPNLRMPEIANEQVKVTHGVDPQTRGAWLQMDVNVPFNQQPITVFSLAGITLRLMRARFEGVSRIEAALGQQPRRVVRGAISGDWELQVGGLQIAELVNCTLRFDDGGHIGFDISADRVRLKQVLAFLSDLMSKFGYSGKGFSFSITDKGIRTTLDLPLPDVQSGAFGIANLTFGFRFELAFFGRDFTISTGLAVGGKVKPFTLTVFILGGAGYFELDVSYTPKTSVFTTTVSLAIFASASLAISLGPISGGIYAYFGITVEYTGSNREASVLTVGVIIMFRGEVSLLGFISVSLCLALEAQYQTGGGLIGRGRVSFKIKIGWFFSININAQVEYRFGAATQRVEMDALAEPTYLQAATEYVNMFAE